MISRLRSRLVLVVCVVAGIAALAASPATASFGIHSFEASYTEAPLAGAEAEALGPPDLTAGSHPYQFTAKITFNAETNSKGQSATEGYPKEVAIELPRGLVGNLSSTPQCPQAIYMGYNLWGNNSKCPVDSQVGTIKLGEEEEDPLFNLPAPAGKAGRIGAIAALIPVTIEFSMRNGSDYGLTAELHNLSEAESIQGVSLTLWGVPSDPGHNKLRCLRRESTLQEMCNHDTSPEPLLTMPTTCTEPLVTTLVAHSWEEPYVSVERSVTASNAAGTPSDLSGCERLHFDPSATVQTESGASDTPTGLSIDVHVPYQEAATELAEASLENLVVALPSGLSLNPATAAGLVGCTPAQFAAGQASRPSCPDAAKIGTLEVHTPLVSKPLSGFVYLAQPPEGLFEGKVAIYLVGEEQGLDFKLAGELEARPDDGQLTLTLNEIPELPLSELRLRLYGGPHGAVANPPTCATFTTTTELTPYSRPSVTALSSMSQVDENCGGGFGPSFRAGATSSTAGQSTGFAIDASRSDGQQYLKNFTVTMPAGEMANISSVPECGGSEAAAGTCPASSEIGTVVVGAGAGPDPIYLDGRIYLTGPYGGAPFGVLLEIPAVVGPFNLGTVLVRGGITVDLATSSMTIATDPLPTILRGIPLRIKNLELAIDRPDFMLNPTSCAQLSTSGVVGSAMGLVAPVSAPFGVRGCAGLLFAPKLTATTLAKASSRGNGAGLDVKVSDPARVQANLKSLVIKLPKALKPRLTTIQQACLAAVFARSPEACSPLSVVGNAVVDTSLLAAPLKGPAYLVFRRGDKFPNLVLVLQGDGLDLQIKGTVEVNKGFSTTTFSPLPDIPMSLFEVNLPEGAHSLLGATEGLCLRQRDMVNAIGGQNGALSKSTVRTTVEGCHGSAARTARRRRAKASARQRSARGMKRGGR